MRDYVASKLSAEQLELYQMYSLAGLEDYSWISNESIHTVKDLQSFANRSGKEYGPGKCLWADEFTLRTVSDGFHLTLLIVDDEAQRTNTKRKRKEEDDDVPDGRYLSIGNYPRAVVMHRTRRQHYNAIVVNGHPVISIELLPLNVRSLWSSLSGREKEDNGKATNNQKSLSDTSLDNQQDQPGDKPASLAKEGTTITATTHTTTGKFYCGCAGFSNSAWVGNFYPKSIVGSNSDRQLNHYQEHFTTVELNSTFYGVPLETTVNKWKSICAKSFKLVVKVPKSVTHEHAYLDGTALSFFLKRMQPLGEVLACILVQCPRTLLVDVAQLKTLKSELQEQVSWYTGGIAIEFRNKTTFMDAQVREFLQQNGWELVMHPDSLERSTIGSSQSGRGSANLVEYEPEKLTDLAKFRLPMTSSSGFVYVRLHGINDEHRGEYTLSQLEEIAEQIHNWRRVGMNVFCFILNDLEPSTSSLATGMSNSWRNWCAMPKNAKQLEKLVFDLSNEKVPSAPKMPKANLLNFFGVKSSTRDSR